MRVRNIIIAVIFVLMSGALAIFLSPKYSAQILFARLVSEVGNHSLTSATYGTHPRHKLDIYKPTAKEHVNQASDRGPIILFLYGGGWRDGRREMYQFIGSAFAKRGFTTIIPDYRTFPEVSFPGFIEDAARAYHWVWKNLAIDRPIIVMGHSAGAHSAG